MLITGLHATPQKQGCVTKTGTQKRKTSTAPADTTCRHFRLTLDGIINTNGAIAHNARGTLQLSVSVKLPRGPAHAGAHAAVLRGRWHVTLVLPGVSAAPTYTITAHYSGDRTTKQATTTQHVSIAIR